MDYDKIAIATFSILIFLNIFIVPGVCYCLQKKVPLNYKIAMALSASFGLASTCYVEKWGWSHGPLGTKLLLLCTFMSIIVGMKSIFPQANIFLHCAMPFLVTNILSCLLMHYRFKKMAQEKAD